MHKVWLFGLLGCLLLIFPIAVFADPSSTHYTLHNYGFGAGGTASSSSQEYNFYGTAGEVEAASSSSQNYIANGGLAYEVSASVPPAPTFTNPGNAYNKLTLVINAGSNPSDATFAIAVSADSFTTDMRFVQLDGTLGASPVWQTTSNWGTVTIIGLKANTTYAAKVSAMQGGFTQSAYGPVATAATINPSLTFSVVTGKQSTPPFTIGFGNSIQANTITTSDDSINLSFSTNAAFGGNIYMYSANSGLKSIHAGHTINSMSADLAGQPEGEGAQISAASLLTKMPPYDGSSGSVGVVDTTVRQVFTVSTPVTNGTGSIVLKAKTQVTTPAANDYTDVVNFIAAALF